jgi:dCTP deaminase
MIVNGKSLLYRAPIKNMLTAKHAEYGVSFGMAEAGYDLRIKQAITFFKHKGQSTIQLMHPDGKVDETNGRFVLASAIEEFQMPNSLMGIVHDKSSWARRGLSVFNTCIEPGWKGFLTLELVYHGEDDLFIPAGSGIAQVVFHDITDVASYSGKYQNQANEPVSAINS